MFVLDKGGIKTPSINLENASEYYNENKRSLLSIGGLSLYCWMVAEEYRSNYFNLLETTLSLLTSVLCVFASVTEVHVSGNGHSFFGPCQSSFI